MTEEDVEREARACYTKCAPCHPAWEQLGEVTKNVWRDWVVFDGMRAAPDLEDLFS